MSGERCVPSPAGGVCELPQESTCADAGSSCAAGLVCAADSQCRAPCQTLSQCEKSQSCISGTCFDDSELDGGGIESDSGGAGSKNGDAGSGVADGGLANGDGSLVSVDGATGSDGNAATDAPMVGDAACLALLPDGGCDYCPPSACANGTCENGDHDYACSCFSGYSGSGTKTCTLTDECLANDMCPAGYPCQPTAPPGEACVGETATWPMPDAVPGAKTSPHYSDNQDGTVTDAVTGLIWQAQLPAVADNCGGSDASASCTEPQAASYCASLRLAGDSDWRLPTMIELASLLDCTRDAPPTIANALNNNSYTTPATGFWTSSVYEGTADNWYINFANCTTNFAGALNTTFSARCVRGTGITSNTPAVHYTIHSGTVDAGLGDAGSGDTVTDNWTGLTWERAVAPQVVESSAVAYCAQLGGGFRLPTVKELLTLIDPVDFNPAIDVNKFPGTPSTWFWTATPVMPSNGTGYTVRFSDGATQQEGFANTNYVRCVQ